MNFGTLCADDWIDAMQTERWRRAKMLTIASDNVRVQGALRAACKADRHFFWDNFLWGHDTRESPAQVPFLAFEKQRELREAYVGERYATVPGVPARLVVDKSRDEGVTALILGAMVGVWLFEDGKHQGCTSRTKDEVDDRTSTSLFGRFRWMLKAIPWYLRPMGWRGKKVNRLLDRRLALINDENHNVMLGTATTADAFRSRRLWNFLCDEAAFVDEKLGIGALAKLRASLNGCSRSGCYASTPNSDEFAGMVYGRTVSTVEAKDWTPECEAGFVHIRIHYDDDPRKGEVWKADMLRQYANDPIRRAREVECDHENATVGRIWPQFTRQKNILSQEVYDERVLKHMASGILVEGWDYGPANRSTACVWLIYWPPNKELGLPEVAVAVYAETFGSSHPVEIGARVAELGYRCKELPDGIMPAVRMGDAHIHKMDSQERAWSRDMVLYTEINIRALRKNVVSSQALMQLAWGVAGREPTLFLSPRCEELASACERFKWRESLAQNAKAAIQRAPHAHICDALTVAYLAARHHCGIIDVDAVDRVQKEEEDG